MLRISERLKLKEGGQTEACRQVLGDLKNMKLSTHLMQGLIPWNFSKATMASTTPPWILLAVANPSIFNMLNVNATLPGDAQVFLVNRGDLRIVVSLCDVKRSCLHSKWACRELEKHDTVRDTNG